MQIYAHERGNSYGCTYFISLCEEESVFTQIGAKKGADSVKVDLAAEEDDIQRLEEFAKKLATAAE